MKKRIIIIAGLAVAAAVCATVIIIISSGPSNSAEAFQFAQVTRGPIRVTIASTGTINAQKTVDVGTQVSGIISKIYADFNDHVYKDQILVLLDTTLLDIAVQSAYADQLKAGAQYELASKDYTNNTLLHDKKLISDYEFETSRVARDAAYAGKLTADANMARAKVNQNNAVIRSPIDGVIINRAVEEGQTVAASLSAPTLFSIAEDLSTIQIKAYVAESDIGSVKKGQRVTFTVMTYPQDVFSGTVGIIHLQSETVSNVVNYVVMVNATNPDKKLLPGMTATITFIVDERKDALLLPNAVLKYRPTEAMLAEYSKNNPDRRSAAQSRQPAKNAEARVSSDVPADRTEKSDPSAPAANRAVLWYFDADGKLASLSVTLGISDGTKTEVISDGLSEGMNILSTQGSSTRGATDAQNNSRRGMPRLF